MDPFFRAAGTALAVIAAFFVSVVVGLVVARSSTRPRAARRLIAQGTALGVFVALLALGRAIIRP